MIHFVGAGPGAPDLITLRGARLLKEADLIIYAGSLVNPELLAERKAGAAVYDSAVLTLPEVTALMLEAERKGLMTVRLHTGDPSLYGAVREQMDVLDREGIPYDVTPGVSSFTAAAAALNLEFTLPEVSQTLIITRMEGRTPVPEKEAVEKLASHGAGMAVFLSAGMTGKLSEALIRGGYAPDTPAAIVYKASWPEERTCVCTVGTLPETAEKNGIRKTGMILVGDFVAHRSFALSKLYDPAFTTGYRKGAAACTEQFPVPFAADAGSGKNEAAGKPSVRCEAAEGTGSTAASAAGGLQETAGKKKKECAECAPLHTVTVVGMGPGKEAGMTIEAEQALLRADVIVGYPVYLKLLGEKFAGKEMLSTPMKAETERCRMAFAEAEKGRNTVMLCSGDAGVYGMASLMLEIGKEFPDTEVRIIPGVTAALSGAALLGAPLGTDFSVISLSDLLTPWEKIEARLLSAARSDMNLVLYNPSSHKRKDYLQRACDLLLTVLPGDRVCGYVKNIGRDGEEKHLLTLSELRDAETDMFTTVFIGCAATERTGDAMVTRRGYRIR